MRLIKSIIQEKKKKMSPDENPCWKGYEMIGTKMKDGKEVPNCVPISKENVKLYLPKNLLDSGKTTMKEYNDSIYSLIILHKKEESFEGANSKKSISIHEDNTSLVEVLNTLSEYVYSIDAELLEIKQKTDTSVSVIMDDPELHIHIDKENVRWRPFEIAQIEAIFLNPAEKKYRDIE